jgi:CheY-like chemotaxis protein
MLVRCPQCKTEFRLTGDAPVEKVVPYFCPSCEMIVRIDLELDEVHSSSSSGSYRAVPAQAHGPRRGRRRGHPRAVRGALVEVRLPSASGPRRRGSPSLIREEHPDLVVLDLLMPRMTGFDVLREIRQDERVKDTTVLAISSGLQETTFWTSCISSARKDSSTRGRSPKRSRFASRACTKRPPARRGTPCGATSPSSGPSGGDEGKGKVVDLLSDRFDVVARYQGGPNAGHTVTFDGRRHALQHIPSGVFRQDARIVIGNGTVLDLAKLISELDNADRGRRESRRRLYISDRAHVILPLLARIDALSEALLGDAAKIGTTQRGIGPTYEAKAAPDRTAAVRPRRSRQLGREDPAVGRRASRDADPTAAEKTREAPRRSPTRRTRTEGAWLPSSRIRACS